MAKRKGLTCSRMLVFLGAMTSNSHLLHVVHAVLRVGYRCSVGSCGTPFNGLRSLQCVRCYPRGWAPLCLSCHDSRLVCDGLKLVWYYESPPTILQRIQLGLKFCVLLNPDTERCRCGYLRVPARSQPWPYWGEQLRGLASMETRVRSDSVAWKPGSLEMVTCDYRNLSPVLVYTLLSAVQTILRDETVFAQRSHTWNVRHAHETHKKTKLIKGLNTYINSNGRNSTLYDQYSHVAAQSINSGLSHQGFIHAFTSKFNSQVMKMSRVKS